MIDIFENCLVNQDRQFQNTPNSRVDSFRFFGHIFTPDNWWKLLQFLNLRKNVWIKRGDFVVVKPIEEGDKVKAEILTILYKEQIKYIKAENQWPVGFETVKVEEEQEEGEGKDKGSEEEEDSEDDSDLFQNTNRPIYSESESSDETESEEEK